MALKSCSHAFSYDVFLSFRGEDTRHGFTGNLYKALHDRGIHTFIDDEELQKGEEITAALKKAIKRSRIAIVVFSKDYASSSFCLDELATILDCAGRKGLLVLPVFYNVDPSHVRHQKGGYGEALAKHEERLKHNNNIDKFENWKMALHHVANLSGFHFNHGDGYEHKFIGRIIEFVSSKINRAPLPVAEYPVGLDSQVLEVRKLLDVGSADDGVRMIGIHGMGGVGKTTLALAVYNSIVAHFDASCFLENVREKANKHGLEHLQSIILSEILGEKKIQLASQPEGISKIQSRLKRKKVLLILDDVDKHEQLRAIAGGLDWFGPGSRVIITTRDKHLLAPHDINGTYEVKELNENDALRLLTWKAFKTEKVDPSYEEVLNRVVTYASGLPLALEVIGSSLFGKSIEEWESAIKQYKRIPHNQILKILKVSFDALEEEEKSVFLDIACCFKGYALVEVEKILRDHYGDCMKYHVGVLVKKSLLKLSHGEVMLHDLIVEMGKEIVRQESPKEPGARSRLWSPEDVIDVLENNTGTSTIEIICVDFPIFDKEIAQWNGKAFKKMKNLKTLIIRNGKFSEGPKYLPNSLRVLEWRRYPSHCLPSDFHPKKLAICMLPDSSLTSHELVDSLKKFVHVRILNFDYCDHLTQISDVSGLPSLEEFSFEYCQTLTIIHDSVGELPKLKILNAWGCSKLTTFPPIKMTSLEKLELSDCSSLESFPEISRKMENICLLDLYNTPIKELPLSFQNLIGLQRLNLIGCANVQLRSSIIMMPKLTYIQFFRCKQWQWIKEKEGEEKVGSIVPSKFLRTTDCNLSDDFFSIGFTRFAHVSYLDLSRNNFTILPECIKEFQSLKILDVSYCKHLQKISGIPPNLITLCAKDCKSLTSSSISMFLNQELHEARKTQFALPGNRIPKWFDHQSRGPSSSFWFRNKFPPKVSCLLVAPLEDPCGGFVIPMVFINGKFHESPYDSEDKMVTMEMDHTYLFDLLASHDPFEVPLENEWNHVEITYAAVREPSMLKATGIHVFKQGINIEDIRFTDPNKKKA